MKYSNYLLLMAILLQSACVKITDIEDQNRPNPNSLGYSAFRATTENPSIYAGPSGNEYSVHLPADIPLEVFRKNLNTGEQVIITRKNLKPHTEGYMDAYVLPGQKYLYSHLSGESILQVEIPTDLVVNTLVFWSPQWKGDQFRRLFLKKGSVLITQGQNLKLEFAEIISEQGLITSFLPGQKAELGKNGRSGGQLFISAKAAKGHLRVLMNGEHGGDGAPGTSYLEPAKPGKDSQRVIQEVSIGMSRSIKVCVAVSDAGNGAHGLAGGNGGLGGNGGSSGELHIHIPQSWMSIEVGKNPGLGGAAGAAGLGQKGGAPGKHLVDRDCARTAKKGVAGKNGENGKAGQPGADGQMETVCLFSKNYQGCF